MAVDLAQARPYLDALFGNMAAGEYLLLYTLPDRRSAWFTDVESACAELGKPKYETTNVYVGVCTSPSDNGPWNRCDAANIASLSCLWADIDVGLEGHQGKKVYAPTIADVMDVLKGCVPPSMVVSTGHGVHVYWLFGHRFDTRRPVDNIAAKELSQRWQAWLKRLFDAKGWTIDGTFDLARVLRIPGTTNFKNVEGKVCPANEAKEALPVELTEITGKCYDWLELSKKIPADIHAETRTTATKASGIGALKLSEDRVLNGDTFNALQLRFRQKFTDSFQRTKPLAGGDQSASAYDASLAMYGVLAGLDDQQIADLLIMSRRNAAQDLKLRQDYYANTISSARREAKKSESIEDLINQSRSTPEAQEALNITPEEARARMLDSLSAVLNVHVDRIVKYDVDPDPMFWMEVGGSRRVLIGTVDVIMELKKFKNKVMATIGALLPDFKRPEWEKIAQLIVNSAEVEQGVADGRFEDSTKSFIREYLLATKVGTDPDEAMALGGAFEKGGHVYVSLESLKKWLYYTRHQDIKDQTLAQYLSNVGCVSKQFTFTLRSSGKQVGRRVWQVPADLVPGNG